VKNAVKVFEAKVRAKRALSAKEAERKEPPWRESYKWWEDPNLLSECELMMKGVKGWSSKSIESLVGKTIGADVPVNVKMVSSGYLACITFRNKEECTAALGKMHYVRNPIKGAAPNWLTCVRAKIKERSHGVDHEKEWDNTEERWTTPKERCEEIPKDKKRSEAGKWINYKDGPVSSSSRQEEEMHSPVRPTNKEQEGPEASAFWTDDRPDTEVSDETYERIEALRKEFPMHWKKLMEIETAHLSNEEALEEVRAEEREELAEASLQKSRKNDQQGHGRSRTRQTKAREKEEDQAPAHNLEKAMSGH
jgi:hypothetical protein